MTNKIKIFFNKQKASDFVVQLVKNPNSRFNVAFKSFLKIKYIIVKYRTK